LLILRHCTKGGYIISQIKDGRSNKKIARFNDDYLIKARTAFKEQLSQSAQETLIHL